jgi:hypothetical protein
MKLLSLMPLFGIVCTQILLSDAHHLQHFNELLLSPISGVFVAHNNPEEAVNFYKVLFEKGWPLLVCWNTDDTCMYLQVFAIK